MKNEFVQTENVTQFSAICDELVGPGGTDRAVAGDGHRQGGPREKLLRPRNTQRTKARCISRH